jgi:SAM-dependent methyltransferase
MSDQERDSIPANRDYWETLHDEQLRLALRQWARSEAAWGVFGIPEKRGATCIGVDPTASQLAIAATMQDRIGPRFPLVRAAGEAVPIAQGSADLVISEYGAAIWADPYRWIPEAARVLRPGGELVFLGNSSLIMLCVPDLDGLPAEDRLLRPQLSMHRFVWPDDPSVEFHLSHGDWIKLFVANGLEVIDLIELYATADAESSYPFVTAEWASRWPCEEAWRLRKR